MKKRLLTAVLLASATVPATAQTVYVPLVQNGALGANQVRTRVWVTNTSDSTKRFSSFFLAAGTDGSADRGTLPKIPVSAFTTSVVGAAGASGMLELTGAPQLRYTGVLEVVDGQGLVRGRAPIPVISSSVNLAAKDASIVLQGLTRSGNRTSSLGVVNLSKDATDCRIAIQRADGTAIGSPSAVIPVAPLSVRVFSDVVGILDANAALSDARATVSCGAQFFAYSLTMDSDGSNPVLVGPATDGNSTLTAPGATAPGVIEFKKDGEFLFARQGASRVEYQIPVVPESIYKLAEIDFDFYLDSFQNPLFHTLSTFRMADIVYAITIRADRLKTIVDSHAASDTTVADWKTKRTYHVRISADTVKDELFIKITRGSEVIQTTSIRLGVTRLGNFSGSKPLRIDFSQAHVYDEGAYWPFWGSRFSNLKVVMTPATPQ